MTDQSKPTKQLGHEYVSANEEEIGSKMVNELTAQLDRLYKDKKMLRQIHTRMHGCVKASFVIEPNLPANLKVGVFSEERTYHAWVRFSNANSTPKADYKKDVRGIAIKLMGVPGEKILNQEHLQNTQDFLLMNTETFFSKNVEEFSGLLSAFTASSKLPLLLFALNPAHWKLLKEAGKANINCRNPLEIDYWGTQPNQYGNSSTAVKYLLSPSPNNKIVVENQTDFDFLRINMAQTLNDNEVRYDFLVQFQTDAELMPVEDPTVAWKSPFVKLATLIIPPQIFDSKEQMEFGDNLSFNAWHSLPQHRPLGSFNRIRKRVYEALSKYRHDKNGIPAFEPQDSPDFLPNKPATKISVIEVEVPKTGVVKSFCSVLVDCSKETAYNYISNSEELSQWLLKFGPISSVKNVEVIKGPYTEIGATRKVTFENDDTIQEELISCHPFANYAYRVTLFSDFLKHLTNAAFGQLWFDTVDDKTRITWVYSYTYKNIFARAVLWLFNQLLFKKYMQKALINAKGEIENAD